MTRPPLAIVFVGPTLPAAEVKRALPCEVRPPAAQGDVWRALVARPRVLVLLDGVFESQPSVWHRELLDALDAGVTVFGAASMGALRAVELAPFGMVGVGQIFRWYRDGVLIDDSEVALLHAGAEHGHRALTLPLVNVRHAAARARREDVLRPQEAVALVHAAESIFYQDRHWGAVLRGVARHWSDRTRTRWDAFFARGLEDPKATDARECLDAARAFLKHAPPPLAPSQHRAPPSHARRRKLMLRLPEIARARAPEGMRTLALAAWARSLGLRPTTAECRRAEDRWWHSQGIASRHRTAFLQARGMDVLDVRRLCEVSVLEQRALQWAARLVPDGPSPLEAAALEHWRAPARKR